jgi:putative nucleotidyltransferase with HDIG domain
MSEHIIESMILKTVDIPTLPPIAMKVMNLIQNEKSSLTLLEDTICSDQGFVTRLLRIANSPFYGQDRKIEDIKQALLLIGFETLKSLVIATALRDLHRKFGVIEQSLWEHSLGVGLCSSMLAKITQLAKPEEALVCGLIHDVGKTIMNNSMPEIYPQLYGKLYESNSTIKDLENEKLGFDHTTIGSIISKKWKLPEKLQIVITYHHTYPYPYYEDVAFADICNIVRVADQICNSLGIGLKKPLEIEVDYESLNLSEDAFIELVGLFKMHFEKQRDFLLS